MSEVFLLGAGFSRAISERMPLTRDLSLTILKHLRTPIEKPIRTMIEEDFEKALTFLSQGKPWLSEAENLRHKALFLDLGNAIRAVFTECAADPGLIGSNVVPMWLQYLIYYWHTKRSTVITLNYDTLIERVAGDQGWKRTVGIPTTELYPLSLTPAAQRRSGTWGADPLDTFKLYKLHGSINWFYSGRSAFYGEPIYYIPCIGGLDSLFGAHPTPEDPEAEQRASVRDKVPLIVPPTLDKSVFFEHESLRDLWFQAGRAISNASRIYCIGYSLPPSDLTMAQFLKTCAPSKPIPMEVVNREPRQDHFAGLLGKSTFEYIQKEADEKSVLRFVIGLADSGEDKHYIASMSV
jgi:hypothetical protein